MAALSPTAAARVGRGNTLEAVRFSHVRAALAAAGRRDAGRFRAEMAALHPADADRIVTVIALSKVAYCLRGLVSGESESHLGYIKISQTQAGHQGGGFGSTSRLAAVASGFTQAAVESIWAAFAALDAALQGVELQTDTLFQGPPTKYLNVEMPAGFETEEDFIASWPP